MSTTGYPIAALTGRAMGVGCTVTVAGTGAGELARRGLCRLAGLESLWSRFLPGSDITRLNSAAGAPTRVSPETVHLVEHMRAGAEMTAGDFNPTLLPLQLAAGDARSLVDEGCTTLPPTAHPFPDLSGVEVLGVDALRLPAGMALDAGGIGKGLAADLVAAELLSAGAASACVNVGGDLRTTGPTPDGVGWAVNVLDPCKLATPVASIAIASGAVATSSSSARRRCGRGPERHHFSLRGGPVCTVAGATVVASTAAWAEVWTKPAFVRPLDGYLAAVTDAGLAALVVLDSGEILTTPAWKEYAR